MSPSLSPSFPAATAAPPQATVGRRRKRNTHDGNIFLYYCPGVLGGNTHDGNIFLYYCPGVLGGNTHDGNIVLYYCPGVLGGNTYDGYILTGKRKAETRIFETVYGHAAVEATHENKNFLAHDAEFFESSIISQEASRINVDLEVIQYVEEHELGDLNEPLNYKVALLDPKFDKWVESVNAEMQSVGETLTKISFMFNVEK
ncbi:hypothetical protein Tco_0610771 [Tanacetum coccineum]